MENGLCIYAMSKPDDSIFNIQFSKSSNSEKKKEKKKKKRREIEGLNDAHEDSMMESDSSSSSEEELEMDMKTGTAVMKKKVKQLGKCGRQSENVSRVVDGKTNAKENVNHSNAQFVNDSDSDSDSDAPMENMEAITNADPAIRKAREAQEALLKKRQEVMDEQKKLMESQKQNIRNLSPIPAPQIFKVSESAAERASRLINSKQSTIKLSEHSEDPSNERVNVSDDGVKIHFRMLDASDTSRKSKENIIVLPLKPNLPFKALFTEFSNKYLQCQRDKVQFVFDGENLSDTDSPDGLEMEDDDIVDVKRL